MTLAFPRLISDFEMINTVVGIGLRLTVAKTVNFLMLSKSVKRQFRYFCQSIKYSIENTT